MASNLDGGLDYESGIVAGLVADDNAVEPAGGARCAGSPALLGPRRASATAVDRTTLLTHGCRTAH